MLGQAQGTRFGMIGYEQVGRVSRNTTLHQCNYGR